MADGFHPPLEEYLEAIHELEEEGTQVIQARLAERIGHSAPAVSEVIRRLKTEGYVTVEDRAVHLTERGRNRAESVVRKHRLAERLLTDIIGLEWHKSHLEACRWEHVISESVEQRLYELLGHPERCPHGNVIPGLDELVSEPGSTPAAHDSTMIDVTRGNSEAVRVTVTRITEQLQSDLDLMLKLKRAGIQPGREVLLGAVDGGVRVSGEDAANAAESADLPAEVASHVFVSRE